MANEKATDAVGVPQSSIGYLADAPVEDPGADRLRRQPFANRIADTIVSHNDPTSLVIGIYGQWGEGKTTVLNFIEQRLAESETVECVRFNPWLYQGETQLLVSFFESLATAVGKSLKTKKEEMGKWLRTLGAALGTVSVGIGLVNVAPGGALQELGESLSSVDILDRRRQLEELLAQSGKRILIMIDDIDRLDDDEIATMFKLVKLAADFKHTAYIVAFDRDVVTKALSKRFANSEDSGSSFIEKIVQVPIELPRADQGVLQTMTLQAMTDVLEGSQVGLADSDINRFSTVFSRYLGPHIGTPRMVKRIANAVEFVVPLVLGEVNVTDLLLLSILGVLFPNVYRKIPTVKDALLGKYFDYGMNDVDQIVRQQLDPLLEDVIGEDADHVKGTLRELFPRIERLYSNYHYGTEWIPRWNIAQRVCAPQYFDRYFSLGIPIGDLADSELQRFLTLVTEQAEVEAAEALEALYEESSPMRFVEKLRTLEMTFDPATAQRVSYALADTSHKLPDPVASPMSGTSSAFGQAAMHIANVLIRISDDERLVAMRRIIETTASLAFASEVLRWSRIASSEDVAEDARALTHDQIKELESILGHRIAEQAEQTPLFCSMPRYAPNLYYDWLQAAGRPVVEQHLTEACAGNFDNSLALLRAFMPTYWSIEGQPTGSGVHRNTYDSIAGLMDPQVILDELGSRFPSVSEEQLPADTSEIEKDERQALRFAQIHRQVQIEKLSGSDGALGE